MAIPVRNYLTAYCELYEVARMFLSGEVSVSYLRRRHAQIENDLRKTGENSTLTDFFCSHCTHPFSYDLDGKCTMPVIPGTFTPAALGHLSHSRERCRCINHSSPVTDGSAKE